MTTAITTPARLKTAIAQEAVAEAGRQGVGVDWPAAVLSAMTLP